MSLRKGGKGKDKEDGEKGTLSRGRVVYSRTNKIPFLRQEYQVSQESLAYAVGCGRKKIRELERQKVLEDSRYTRLIACVFGVDFDYLRNASIPLEAYKSKGDCYMMEKDGKGIALEFEQCRSLLEACESDLEMIRTSVCAFEEHSRKLMDYIHELHKDSFATIGAYKVMKRFRDDDL